MISINSKVFSIPLKWKKIDEQMLEPLKTYYLW